MLRLAGQYRIATKLILYRMARHLSGLVEGSPGRKIDPGSVAFTEE